MREILAILFIESILVLLCFFSFLYFIVVSETYTWGSEYSAEEYLKSQIEEGSEERMNPEILPLKRGIRIKENAVRMRRFKGCYGTVIAAAAEIRACPLGDGLFLLAFAAIWIDSFGKIILEFIHRTDGKKRHRKTVGNGMRIINNGGIE